MSILTKLRSDMRAATLARDYNTQSITKVVLGEIDRSQKQLNDEDVFGIIKKLIESNQETMSYCSSQEILDKLSQENKYLGSLLPKTLTPLELIHNLRICEAEIKSAKNDGMGIGIAIKYCKSNGLSVDGKSVASAVKLMRSQ